MIVRVGLALALLWVAAWLATGCASSVSASWTIARGAAATGACGATEAESDHLDPAAVRAIGEAAGASAAAAIRGTVDPSR